MNAPVYQLPSNLTIRDERSAGSARVGVVWRNDQPADRRVVDHLGLETLSRLRSPCTLEQLAEAALRALPQPQQRGVDLSALGGRLLSALEQHGWIEPAQGQPSTARWFDSTDPSGYRPGWVPLRAPLDLVLSVTMACNLRCRHCGVSCGPETARPNELTLIEIAALLHECHEIGVNDLTLTGGEVTIRSDWHDILRSTIGKAFSLVMISNGVRYSDEDLAFLEQFTHQRGGEFRVAMSLDGATAGSHGFMRGGDITFERTVANARRLVERGVRVDFGMTLTPLSSQEMPAALELAADIGVTSVELHPVEIYGRAQGDHELWMPRREVRRQIIQSQDLQARALELGVALYYEAKRTPFTKAFLESHGVKHETEIFRAFAYPDHAHDAGLVKVCIDADGVVYPSEKAQGFAPLAIGNIRNGGLLHAWRESGWDFFRGGWSPEDLHQCRGCPIEDRCSTKTNRIIPHVSLNDPLAAMPECQSMVRRWSQP